MLDYTCTTLKNAIHARIQRGTKVLDPLENHKAIGCLSTTDPYPFENHKATESVFGRYLPASKMPLNGVLLVGQ